MTLSEYEQQRQAAFSTAMAELVMNPNFGHFIETLREYRERAIDSLTDGSVIASDRSTLACIGEIAAYKSIIVIYDDFRKRGAESGGE